MKPRTDSHGRGRKHVRAIAWGVAVIVILVAAATVVVMLIR
jgi:hypothetical protein